MKAFSFEGTNRSTDGIRIHFGDSGDNQPHISLLGGIGPKVPIQPGDLERIQIQGRGETRIQNVGVRSWPEGKPVPYIITTPDSNESECVLVRWTLSGVNVVNESSTATVIAHGKAASFDVVAMMPAGSYLYLQYTKEVPKAGFAGSILGRKERTAVNHGLLVYRGNGQFEPITISRDPIPLPDQVQGGAQL